MQQLTLSCCERENGPLYSEFTNDYLAWYLVRDQEDEFQSAAAVFLSKFCTLGGFADKYYAGVSRKHLSLIHLIDGKILPVASVCFFLQYCNIEPADPHGRHHF
ncbi:hypothetical protein T12_398 [Trichinella patagoniensis]|uniref:Uncharacterized protein n=1 Tax=Trichinella patagoniensis TaxID=990121 RepID=A0A0V1AB20_9BILA|nr:hypothetical protein T12_398 [Trichinella patagoniensis]